MAQPGRKPNLSLRLSILTACGEHGAQTIARLAGESGSNPVTIKSHLSALEGLGFVTPVGVHRHSNAETGAFGRGRPARMFEITDAGRAALSVADPTSAVMVAVTQPSEAVAEVAEA